MSNDRTLEPVDQAEKVITPTAASAVGGAIIGSHRAFGIGLLPGAGLGAALGLGAVLLKRGDEINLPQGSKVEMVLQAPFSLEQAQMSANARCARPRQALNDPQQAANARWMPRSARRRQRAAFGTINPFKILVPVINAPKPVPGTFMACGTLLSEKRPARAGLH